MPLHIKLTLRIYENYIKIKIGIVLRRLNGRGYFYRIYLSPREEKASLKDIGKYSYLKLKYF